MASPMTAADIIARAVEEAFRQVAKWHDKSARLCLEASKDDQRMNADDQLRAFESYKHHAASAAAIRNKMADERRAAIRKLAEGKEEAFPLHSELLQRRQI